MFQNDSRRITGIGVTILFTCFMFAAFTVAQPKKATKPPIEITTIPPAGAGPNSQELIAGRVNVDNPGNYKVCIYSHTDRWYVEPYIAAPLTDVNPSDGHWQTRIYLGEEYAAILVKPSYKPAATMLELPSTGSDIIAVTRVAARR